MHTTLLQKLPSVEILLNVTEIETLIAEHGRDVILAIVRKTLERLRDQLCREDETGLPDVADVLPWVVSQVASDVRRKFSSSLRKAINASGVVLHTGLGRAVLSDSAAAAIQQVIRGYCTLATSVETGRRGHRDDHLNGLICELTGAQAATVVNNNAAATMLILNTLAQDREVILSRGQLVEIGGSFRIPDVMRTSGAVLREVGTTNKTHLRDYAGAICEETGALMRVHHSNYRILGFSSEPGIAELTQLAHQHGLHMIDDIGSGALVNLSPFGLENEPLIADSVKAGVDVACFSGDKLIGGPQAGIIIGKKEVIRRIGKNPLMRAFRVGKTTIAGLEATLKLFLRPSKLVANHPVYRMFAASREQLARRARRLKQAIRSHLPPDTTLAIINGSSQVGSGSVPVETMPTKILQIQSKQMSALTLAKKLRDCTPPIFVRVHKESIYLDLRTIQPDEDKIVKQALIDVFQNEENK